MSEITVCRDDEPDLQFTGEMIATVSDQSYQGPTQSRWRELSLYKTLGGNFVCHKLCRSQWEGEGDSYEASIEEDPEGVIVFFGHSDLAKELYAQSDITDVELVE